MSSFTEYTEHDAIGLAELVRKGEVHPTELVEAAIERIERYNPALNAVIDKLYDEIVPRYGDRNSGYTRVVKIGPRAGDNAPIVQLELV